MTKQRITIEFARCTKFTHGNLDIHPFSAYEIAKADVDLASAPSMEFDGKTDWAVLIGYRVIGCGDSASEAISDAQYHLMDESRTHQQELSFRG